MTANITVIAALIIAVAGLALFVLVLIGARHEHPTSRPSAQPPGPLASLARRVLGLHVHQAPPADQHDTASPRTPASNTDRP